MKIPESAKKVFSGVVYDVYQWEQVQFDGTTATYEAIKRTPTIQIIPVKGDRILLSHEEQPLKSKTLTFFGGRLEQNEDPLVGAQRELREETGMTSDDWYLFKTYESPGNIDWTTHLYIARNIQKTHEPHLDAGEKIDIVEFSFDDFFKEIFKPDFWSGIIAADLHKLTHDEAQLEEFRKLLFKV